MPYLQPRDLPPLFYRVSVFGSMTEGGRHLQGRGAENANKLISAFFSGVSKQKLFPPWLLFSQSLSFWSIPCLAGPPSRKVVFQKFACWRLGAIFSNVCFIVFDYAVCYPSRNRKVFSVASDTATGEASPRGLTGAIPRWVEMKDG